MRLGDDFSDLLTPEVRAGLVRERVQLVQRLNRLLDRKEAAGRGPSNSPGPVPGARQ